MTDLIVRQADAGDWTRIAALLVGSGLPVDDLSADKLDQFLVADNEAAVVGLIGLQLFGTTGLLRSLVVAEDARRLGLGTKLIAAIEIAAQSAGVTELWLLTIDAEKFFARHGFVIVDRDVVPVCIQQTEEFSNLCPGTAFLMQKELG